MTGLSECRTAPGYDFLYQLSSITGVVLGHAVDECRVTVICSAFFIKLSSLHGLTAGFTSLDGDLHLSRATSTVMYQKKPNLGGERSRTSLVAYTVHQIGTLVAHATPPPGSRYTEGTYSVKLD